MHKKFLFISIVLVVISVIVINLFPFTRMVKVVYVSHDEIISLEKQRIKESREDNLFMGEIGEALKHIENVSARHGNNRTIVIYSISPVYTKGVESISLNVYQEVIDELKRSLK